MGKRLLLLMACLMTVLLCAVPSFAADEAEEAEVALSGSDAKIAVEQDFSSNVTGGKRTVEYTLAATDKSYPLPEGAKDGKYTFTLDDDAEDEISFAIGESGEYEYTLYCSQADASGYTYDDTTYRVTVTATVGSDASAIVPIIYDADDKKVKVAKWRVEYRHDAAGDDDPGNTADNNRNTPGGGTNGSTAGNIPKMEDVISGAIVFVAAGLAVLLVIAAFKRRKKEDDSESA